MHLNLHSGLGYPRFRETAAIFNKFVSGARLVRRIDGSYVHCKPHVGSGQKVL